MLPQELYHNKYRIPDKEWTVDTLSAFKVEAQRVKATFKDGEDPAKGGYDKWLKETWTDLKRMAK